MSDDFFDKFDSEDENEDLGVDSADMKARWEKWEKMNEESPIDFVETVMPPKFMKEVEKKLAAIFRKEGVVPNINSLNAYLAGVQMAKHAFKTAPDTVDHILLSMEGVVRRQRRDMKKKIDKNIDKSMSADLTGLSKES